MLNECSKILPKSGENFSRCYGCDLNWKVNFLTEWLQSGCLEEMKSTPFDMFKQVNSSIVTSLSGSWLRVKLIRRRTVEIIIVERDNWYCGYFGTGRGFLPARRDIVRRISYNGGKLREDEKIALCIGLILRELNVYLFFKKVQQF